MLKTNKIKQDFPIFKRKINGRPLIYLDSASTSQKPQQVIDAVMSVYKYRNANIHRGIYTISEETTKLFEGARDKVAKFINAKDSSEIIFTHNTTEALNIVAYGLGQTLKKGDTILISEMEHHSNIVPWQRVAKAKGAQLLFIPIDSNGELVLPNFKQIKNLKIVSLAHVSNVLGIINPIQEIVKKVRSQKLEVTIIVDAAQSVPHMPVDVQRLGCDFLAFSGHKMLAPTGVGVLWGRKKILEKIEPLLVGSHMIREVTKKKSTWNDLPWKFEPGTAAIEAVIGLGVAIDYLNKIEMEEIRDRERKLTKYALEKLEDVEEISIYGPKPVYDQYTGISGIERSGVISFNIEGVHSHDVAQILDGEGICIRSGHHCAMPLHQRLGIEASCRTSFYLYNDKEDIDKLIEGINKVKKIFKI